ncbi:MAG: U32 family peptidase [Treponema sp.]|jgi:putative protease|nr:U32 family peptidase [Treponema sp.]
MKTLELLAPAGSPEALDAAVGEGADAVYLGLKNFNARLRSANFAYSQFEGALRSLHRMGRKLYVTVNTVFEQREADRLYQLLKYVAALGPDGLIVQDFGIIPMVRDNFPALKLHASTQMNIASARGANVLSKYGVSRVVLARELSLEELRDIRVNTNMELEIFVHGALCISASGLCLFSSFLGGKSANRGMCTQACRRYYRRDDRGASPDREAGGYYFSPSDLQLLEQVPDLVRVGVNAFKIEGRMKSAEYVGTVVSAYRLVLDALQEESTGDGEAVREAVAKGLSILRNDFARTKTAFYYDPGYSEGTIDWLKPDQSGGTGIPLGIIHKVKGSDDARRGLIVSSAMMPVPGDSARFHRADDSDRKSHKLIAVEPDGSGGHNHKNGADASRFWISIPEGFDVGDAVYLIQTRTMSKRYAPVIPHAVESFRRTPGRDQAPLVHLPPVHKTVFNGFPEGLYVGTSRIEDLYILQSVRPVKVMLAYNCTIAALLLRERKPLIPFTPEEIILVLDPYFPQDQNTALTEEIPVLISRGYRRFVINNPGQVSYFRHTNAVLIAGPYLYVFNRWAASFVSALGMDLFISPLENNRQNLERTVDPGRRAFTFITVFAYPALFRIRADLGGAYDFQHFRDSREEGFTLVTKPGSGSQVIPEKPCSLVDKIPFLREAGFRRFILDVSGPPLKKVDYKDLMRAAQNALPLPGTGRFNWKDGFYQGTSP